ncbi:Uncharacterized protein QTN25_010826 [Entamoeba marina]
MSSSSTSRPTRTFLTYASTRTNRNTKQTNFTTMRNTHFRRTTKPTSGRLKQREMDDEFENVSTIPRNRLLYFLSLIFPCIGFLGFFSLRSQNRRETVWAVALIVYFVTFALLFVIILGLFISFY